MNTILKRVLSMMLCLVLATSNLPVNALAAENGETVTSEATEVSMDQTQATPEETEASSEEAEALTDSLETTESYTEATESSAEVTEPSTEATEPSTETAESSAEAAEADVIAVIADEDETTTNDDSSIIVIAGSDFQNTNFSHTAGANQVTSILKQIVNAGYTTADGFLFAGDYYYGYDDSANGKAALQEAVQTVYGTNMDEIYVQGNHDPDSLTTDGTLSTSGAHDATAYGVYVINEKDYMWHNNDEATIKATAEALDSYLDAKVDAEYEKPIFVVSHLPLHYCMRTYNDGDGMYANYIFDVLNEAGAAGLNIIFMFGHNHSNGWDDYLGGAAIYLEKGDNINIAQGSETVFDTETLNFYYMNAGYVAYYRNVNTGSETDLTMTVFEITDDTVTVKRFSDSGVHDLKSEGVTNSYKNETGYDPDTTVYESPQTIKLSKFVENVTITESGVSVTAPGITGLYVSSEVKNVEGYTAYLTYDITLDGYSQGDKATVTVPVTDAFDASKPVVVLDQGAVIATTNIVNSTVTFTTNHFSEYDVAQVDAEVTIDPSNWVTITAPTEAGTKYVYELDTNGVDTGVEYLIVANSYAKALSAAASSSNYVDITIDGNYAYADSDTYGWTFTRDSNGVYYIRLNGSTYLRYNNGLTSSNSTGNGRSWTVSGNDDGSYAVTYTSKRRTYNLRWSNSNSVFQASPFNTDPVRLYKYSKTETTEASAGLYGTLVGNTTYEVIQGTSEETALAAVKAGIAVYYTADNTAATGTLYGDDENSMSWTFQNTYDPNTTGTYPVVISYNGVKLGTVNVVVVAKQAASITVSPMSGKVQRGSSLTTETGSTMKVTYTDGSTAEIPVTLAMLDGSYDVTKNGTYTGLTVSYGGQTVTEYTLQVVNVAGNDFPTYPNPGSVEVDKSATGVDFQNTGLARVELSTSGLPAGQGVDVVIVIDTSSSMKDNKVGSTSKYRIEVLAESLEDMLTQFQTANATTGQVADVDIAIIDFNGYYSDSAADYDKISLNNTYRSNVDYAKVFTGNNAGSYIKNITLSADNFVESTSLSASTIAAYFTRDNCKSGTNYDGALENAYKLLAAKKKANQEAGVERDQYVIFLSDGAPFRYNGFNNGSSDSTYAAWNNWLTGYWANETALLSAYNNLSYSYFYNGNGSTHPHRIAEAIKGDVNTQYDVVLREAANNDPAYIDQYQGLGATIYSIGFGLADDGDVVVATQQELIQVISSGDDYYYPNVQTAEELTDAFTQIVTGISYAAQNAVFEDQMGTAFDLQMNPTVKTNNSDNADEDGNTKVDTSITVTTHSIYTSAQVGTEVNGYTVTSDDVGKAYGDGTVVEKVTFTTDDGGNITATSTAVTEADGNILNDGVICAKNFFYNTTQEIKTITLVDGSTYDLPGETFYWNIGTINEKQYTLSYLVYLTGSMEGQTLPSDSYDTNNYAKLSYTNWLGNEVSQSVPSPSMPWGGANVSYAFYLVDENGNPLLQDGTQAVNFLTAYKVTQPVLYKTINLNAGETVLSAIGKDVLPYGYTLYDETAAYTVTVQSGDGNSNWVIIYNSDKVQSTYVMGYADAQDYSNATSVSENSYDYTHTTVYFAVKWSIGTVPDAVVIDYGLPVDISVLSNDMFGGNGTLVGVGLKANMSASYTDTLNSNFANSVNGTYGTANVNGDKVTYTLSGMTMDASEKLAYAVSYTGSTNAGYYYGEVTVIPATTIYYEDTFLTLSSYTKSGTTWTLDESTKWSQSASTGTQDEDRPGEYSLGEIDANNVYGYDSAYESMSTHSLGNAAKITVDANSYATAEFTFYGTGFDVISMTSDTTGTITVLVKEVGDTDNDGTAGETVRNTVVDTYYGMNEDGSLFPNNPTALYQVPVIKIFDLPYGQYTVKITAAYSSVFDHNSKGSYELYLDAIRIYDPAGTTYGVDGDIDQDIQDAYIADGEGWPAYEELRNNIIAASNYAVTDNEDGTVIVDGEAINGVVFIDCADETSSIKDYVSYGPNNELYLAPNQAIAFNVTTNAYVADVQLGMKLGNGSSVTYTINGDQKTISTTTDMYYSILSYAKSGTVTIKNISGGILSLTNIKVTYTQDPASIPSTTGLIWNDADSVGYALRSLRATVVEDEVPETTAPEETVPEETVPEETEPEEIVPEETEPEETVPEETEPEETVPEETEPEETVPEDTESEEDTSEEVTQEPVVEIIRKIVKKLFGWLFG